jgi:hypothetical protein
MVGSSVDAAQVEAALDASASAGPARFRALFSLSAERAGYFQTMSRTDGVVDLAASRGLAAKEDFPGIPLSSKREIALIGNGLFSRSIGPGAQWEKAYGGARAFLGLDVPGDSAIEVLKAALPEGGWAVIESGSTDPPGSIRLRAQAPNPGEVVIVIDAEGRWVSLSRSSVPGESQGGRVVHEMTLTEFGVRLEFEAPR